MRNQMNDRILNSRTSHSRTSHSRTSHSRILHNTKKAGVKNLLFVLALCLLTGLFPAGITHAETSVKVTDSSVKAVTGSREMTYKRFIQKKQHMFYLRAQGCVTTATAIIASAFGKNVTPASIVNGSKGSRGSERYAVSKLKKSARNSSLRGFTALTVTTAGQILEDLDIPVKVVYSYKADEAIAMIREHLREGKPVLAKCNNHKVGRYRIAHAHHAVVLIGLDSRDRPIFIDPMTGKLNYAHASRKTMHVSLETFVKKYMLKAGRGSKNAYVTTIRSGGGFILVG